GELRPLPGKEPPREPHGPARTRPSSSPAAHRSPRRSTPPAIRAPPATAANEQKGGASALACAFRRRAALGFRSATRPAPRPEAQARPAPPRAPAPQGSLAPPRPESPAVSAYRARSSMGAAPAPPRPHAARRRPPTVAPAAPP